MKFDLLLFDLDGTLYDQACGYEANIHANIFEFMAQAKGTKFDRISTVEEAKIAWQPVFDKYNLTKRGLLAEGYEFDTKGYDRCIRHGVSRYIPKQPAEDLRLFLESLPTERKVIFTNAPEESANEILEWLGVKDLFETVLGSDFMGDALCKPERAAFDKVLTHLGIPQADSYPNICYFEDSFKNLEAGRALGFAAVFVVCPTLQNEGRSEEELSRFDAIVPAQVSMSLKETFPDLWE